MQELQVWSRFIYFPHRQASDDMPVLPEGLLYPLKELSLSAVLFCITQKHCSLDLRKQLADFERSTKPMGDAIPIGQLICMALRYRSDQIGCPQPAL
jgi:hypothetical protein